MKLLQSVIRCDGGVVVEAGDLAREPNTCLF